MSLCRPFITPESTSPCALVTRVNYDRSLPVSFPFSVPMAPFPSESAFLFLESCVFEAYTSLSRVGQTAAIPSSARAGDRVWQHLGSRSGAMRTQIATQDHGRRDTFQVETLQLSAAAKVVVACRCRPLWEYGRRQ
jgi:hypothetical protein